MAVGNVVRGPGAPQCGGLELAGGKAHHLLSVCQRSSTRSFTFNVRPTDLGEALACLSKSYYYCTCIELFLIASWIS